MPKIASLCCDPVIEPKSNLLVKTNLAAELVQVAVQPKSLKFSQLSCCKEQAVNCNMLNNVHKRLEIFTIKLTPRNYIKFHCKEPEMHKNKEHARFLLPLPRYLLY